MNSIPQDVGNQEKPVNASVTSQTQLSPSSVSSYIYHRNMPAAGISPYLVRWKKDIPRLILYGSTVPDGIMRLGKLFFLYEWSEIKADQSAYYVIFEGNERGRSEGWRLWGDFEGQDWYGQALNFETKYLGPKVDTTVTSTTATPETLFGVSPVLPSANGEQSVPPPSKQETPISAITPSRTSHTRAKESKESKFFREREPPKAMISHFEPHSSFLSTHLVIPRCSGY